MEKTVNVETTNARATTTLRDTTPTVPLPDTPQGLMVIGPQVTLHFVEEEWNQANSYDYYDVVQVDGTSYIAVQDVPANTEITNTEYWAKWNDPNAQVELMQDTIAQYNSRLSAIENLKEVVVIGDSWTAFNQGSNVSLTNALQSSLVNKTMHNFGENGAGFIQGSAISNINFMDMIQDAVDDDSFNNDNVSDIVVVGGTNDVYHNLTSQLNTTLKTFFNQLVSNFKNANIIWLPNFYAPANAPAVAQLANVNLYYNKVTTINPNFFLGISAPFVDTLHLTDNTQAFIGRFIGALVNGCGGTEYRQFFFSANTIGANFIEGISPVQSNSPNRFPIIIRASVSGISELSANYKIADFANNSFYNTSAYSPNLLSNLLELYGEAFVTFADNTIQQFQLYSQNNALYLGNTSVSKSVTNIVLVIFGCTNTA